MTGSSPSWYEILGVGRDATPDEIKAAWRAATDKFEPGSGTSQFRLFNEAADVLLDPARRAAYDAELDADAARRTNLDAERRRPGAEDAASLVEKPESDIRMRATEVDATDSSGKRSHQPVHDQDIRRGTWIVLLVLARLGAVTVLAVLAVAAMLVAGWYGYQAHRDGQVEQARDEAPAAADRALEQVLAYDYRHLGADEQRAARYLTAHYKQKNHFDATYKLLARGKDGRPGPAVTTKTVVNAHVLGTAVVDAAPDLARVLVFVNQSSTKAGKDPVVFQNRVVATMVKSGNDWLIDDLKSY